MPWLVNLLLKKKTQEEEEEDNKQLGKNEVHITASSTL